MREQLLGVGGGLGVGVRESSTRVQQLTQHGRHVLVALARLLIERSRSKVGALGRPALRLLRLLSGLGCAPERVGALGPQRSQAGWSGGAVVTEGSRHPLNQLPFGTLPLRESSAELLPRRRQRRGLAQRQCLREQLRLIRVKGVAQGQA